MGRRALCTLLFVSSLFLDLSKCSVRLCALFKGVSSFTFSKVLTFRPLEIVQKGARGPGGRKGARAELSVAGPAFQRAWPAGFVVAMFKGRKVDKIRLKTAHPHTSSASNSPECHPGQAGRAGRGYFSTFVNTTLAQCMALPCPRRGW